MRLVFAFAYLGGAAWLAGWELAGLATRRGWTISEFWWQVEGRGWTFARYFTLAALLWFTGHMVWGLFTLGRHHG